MLSLKSSRYEKNETDNQESPGNTYGDFVNMFYFRSGDLHKQFFFN